MPSIRELTLVILVTLGTILALSVDKMSDKVDDLEGRLEYIEKLLTE